MRYQIGHVRASHEWAGEDSGKAELFADFPVLVEDMRPNILDDIEFFPFGLQVLANRHDLTAGSAELLQHVDDLFPPLAESEHQPRLGRDRRIDALHLAQDTQRPLETRSRANVV